MFFWLKKPSNDRVWSQDQAILAYAEIKKPLVKIYNIRNFSYKSEMDYTPDYYDKTFNIDEIESLDYILTHFTGYKLAAHAMLSFGFKNNQHVIISIEIRKKKGDKFSAVKGLFNEFELMYVVGDEKDLVQLRSNHRKDNVYLYPIKISKNGIKNIFLDMLKKANELKDTPEFYNTIFNSCVVNLVKHANKGTAKKIPMNIEVFLPENSDRFIYNLGLIDTTLSFEETRKKFRINQKAEKYANSPDFSVKIRK
jgi:hypothetical protein